MCNFGLLLSKPYVNGFCIHCSLVDSLQILQFRPSSPQVILSSKDQGNVMNQPFSVDSHELVAEGVRLDAQDQLFHVVGMVKTVDGADVNLLIFVHFHLPELN